MPQLDVTVVCIAFPSTKGYDCGSVSPAASADVVVTFLKLLYTVSERIRTLVM